MGKWHLSSDPLPYGFDINIGGTHSGSPPRGYYPPHPNAPGLQGLPANSYLTDYLNDQADQFIRENKDRPWLLYLTHFAVHTPLDERGRFGSVGHRASLRAEQVVKRKTDELARLNVRLACVGDDGRPRRMPTALRSALSSSLDT